MYTFTYKHGDRPLEGYTIERAAGRGGFGEVYYAISDSGREVALKAVQGYEQIELRGISQCMNLKSPHLVTIFDVKYSGEGRPFVVMEFVSGPSLRQLIDESPSGLGEQKSAFFLREIGKGLSFLHDCGIVHRDLKPGNIFYENGYVKIGDYGLSKALGPAAASGQTITVGTLHYMAPEIGAGKYDRSIDIYALGALLYEMLTGLVPFVGASPSEILMKHLSAEPDVSGIAEPFATVIRRAMAKDPNQRYQTVQEMVEAVFGSEHVRDSVSVFSPQELSVVAGRVAGKMAGGGVGSSAAAPGLGAAWRGGKSSSVVGAGAPAGPRFGGAGHQTPPPIPFAPASLHEAQQLDPMSLGHRALLALGVVWVSGLLGFAFSSNLGIGFGSLLGGAGGIVGLMLGRRWLSGAMAYETPYMQRYSLAAITSAFMFFFSLPAIMAVDRGHGFWAAADWIAMAAPLVLMDTRRWFDPNRSERCRLGSALGAAVIAAIAASLLDQPGSLPAFAAMAVAAGSGALAPWLPAYLRNRGFTPVTPAPTPAGGAAPPRIAGLAGTPIAAAAPVDCLAAAGMEAAPVSASMAMSPDELDGVPLPPWTRWAWLGGTALLISSGVALLARAGLHSFGNPDFAHGVQGGIALLMIGVTCFLQSFRTRVVSYWSYIILPVIVLGCAIGIASSAAWLGNIPDATEGEQTASIFFIVLGAITIVLILVAGLMQEFAVARSEAPSPSDRGTAILLAFLPGVHRFYTGRFYSGVLWLVTFGLWGVGTVFDIVQLARGRFRDSRGRRLLPGVQGQAQPMAGPATAVAVPMAVGNTQTWAAQLRDDFKGQVGGGVQNWIDQTLRPALQSGKEQRDAARARMANRRQWRQQMRDWKRMQRSAYEGTRLRNRMSPLAWLLHIACTALVGFALVLTVVLSLHGPAVAATVFRAMADAGHPVHGVPGDLDRAVMTLHRSAAGLVAVMVAFGLTGIVIARRNGGGAYMVRGVAGPMLRFIAVGILADALLRPAGLDDVARRIVADNGNMTAATGDVFMGLWDTTHAMTAAVVFLAGVLVSAWPARALMIPPSQVIQAPPMPAPQTDAIPPIPPIPPSAPTPPNVMV